MRRLSVFNSVSIDGYFTDANSSIEWAHKNANDPEWQKFVAGNARGESVMLFGRKTYEMMKGHWPTEQAKKAMPDVAKSMNESQKIVFSRSMQSSDWENTSIVHDDPAEAIRQLKAEPGLDMIIFGSGSIIAQLAPTGLIDRYTLVVIPVALGKGRTMFEGSTPIELRPTSTRSFKNGNVVTVYVPASAKQQQSEPQRAQRTRRKTHKSKTTKR